jgi:hypothetical protein
MALGSAPVKTSADLRPLCYEHHVEMKPVQILLERHIHPEPTLAYACPEPDCLIYYTSKSGYFVTSTPDVICPLHGLSMYLAEVNPERRSFRLWRCPQVGCEVTHTNDRLLVGGTERSDQQPRAASL